MGTGLTAALTAARALATKIGSRPALSAAGNWLKKNAVVKVVAGEVATTAAFSGVRSAASGSAAAKVVTAQRKVD